MSDDDASIRDTSEVNPWKVAEYEKHFNIIQAGIRALASTWLLAAFGSIGLVLKGADESFVIPQEWLLVVICCMAAIGVLLLWVVDQRVYHNLLNAIFAVGLRVELLDPHVPPVHTMMMASSPEGIMKRRLRRFYAGPVAALGITAIAIATYYIAASDDSVTTWSAIPLCTLAALTLVGPLIVMYCSPELDMDVDQMGALWEEADENDDYRSVLARYRPGLSERETSSGDAGDYAE